MTTMLKRDRLIEAAKPGSINKEWRVRPWRILPSRPRSP